MTEVTEALNTWQRTDPRTCKDAHLRRNGVGFFFWKKDDEVCERELAWRKYVRLRDEKPDWPEIDAN